MPVPLTLDLDTLRTLVTAVDLGGYGLDEAGVPWRLAAVSPSLSGLWASALGGLGVTARSALGLPRGLT